MPRDSSVYLEDILGAIAKINRYTDNASKEAYDPYAPMLMRA